MDDDFDIIGKIKEMMTKKTFTFFSILGGIFILFFIPLVAIITIAYPVISTAFFMSDSTTAGEDVHYDLSLLNLE